MSFLIHDHSRFLTRTNQTVGRTASMGAEAANQNVNKGIMRAAVMIQMTWPGAPTLYYGDEAGLCGWTDPDNRRTYPWGREDQNLIQYHRDIIAIHKEEEAFNERLPQNIFMAASKFSVTDVSPTPRKWLS